LNRYKEIGGTKGSATRVAEVVEHFGLNKWLAIIESKLGAITKTMWIVVAGIIVLVL